MRTAKRSHRRGQRRPLAQAELYNFGQDEKGTAIVLLAAAASVLIGAAGLAFDAGRGYLIQARLSQAVDAAALAGGRVLTAEGSSHVSQIEKYLQANLSENFMGATFNEPQISVNQNGTQVTVRATATIPTTLMKVFKVADLTVSAEATVHRQVKGLEVAMVLDNSGSMSGAKMTDLKDASKLLVNVLYGESETVDDLHVAVVPFTGRTNLRGSDGVHPANPPRNRRVCLDTRAAPDDVSEEPPSEAALDHYSGTYAPPHEDYKERVCPRAQILPLEPSKTNVNNRIDRMRAEGCTRFDIGAVWGWRTVSENWRGLWGNANLPIDYDDSTIDKAVIIMTDGENTPDCVDDPESQSQSETMFSTICAGMKARGIVVYTITFMLNDSDTNQLFENCASGSARYFKSPSGEQLSSAFAQIGDDLSTLRLTK